MNVFDYIKQEENNYQTVKIPIQDGLEWNMYEHVRKTNLYLNSAYLSGKDDNTPFFNITLPAVELQHRALDTDVKDINIYATDSAENYKSFLFKKYHEKWAREEGLDEFLDEATETFTNYGGVLVKRVRGVCPEVVPFERLAFCDQTDILSGPICERHQMTPDQLDEMRGRGWDEETINLVLDKFMLEKTSGKLNAQHTQTPTQYIEIYELHGVLPESFVDDNGELTKYSRQVHIVTFVKDDEGKEQGLSFVRQAEREQIYEAQKRTMFYGRALGRGAVEELFEQQIWTNYHIIQLKEMLDQASKVIYQTADQSFTARNSLAKVDNGDVLTYSEGKPLSPLNNQNINISAFESVINKWNENIKGTSSSYDAITGATNTSGVPFRLEALRNQEARSLHEYRKEKVGKLFRRLYRKWIIPDFKRAVTKDTEFLSELSLDEMQELSESVMSHLVNDKLKEKVLNGGIVEDGDKETLTQLMHAELSKSNKKFFKLFKDEMKNAELDIDVNITGEQRDNQLLADKLSSVFTTLVPILGSNPGFFDQNPELTKLFNEILDVSGIKPIMFKPKPQMQQPQAMQQLQPLTLQPNGQ